MADGGVILILAVLILGGLIATLGDRIGTKVGKARLSLFNLRPRKTAVLVTVFTGVLISASTLGILLLASQGFRDMLLRFDTIRSSLDRTKKDLDLANGEIKNRGEEKKSIEAELTQSRAKSRQVQNTLNRINESLKTAISRQRETESRRQAVERQAVMLRSSILSLQQEQQVLARSRDEVRVQIAQRDQELAARSGEVVARDREIKSKEKEIQSRQVTIALNETNLKKLELERVRLFQESLRLAQDVKTLEKESARLEGRNFAARFSLPAIPRSKLLANGQVAEIRDPRVAVQAIARLLQIANDSAFRDIKPGIPVDRGILNVDAKETKQMLDELARKMSDGGAYLLQIRSAENYFLDEDTPINIQTVLVPYRELFPAGSSLASVTIDPTRISLANLKEELNQLVPKSRLRVSSQGWLPDVGNEGIDISQVPALGSFVDQIRERSEPIEIRAITTQRIYPDTAIIPLELVALQRGIVVFQTRTLR